MSMFKQAFRLAPFKHASAFNNTSLWSNAMMKQSKRFFNLHEYQGHELFKEFGINVPAGEVAGTPEEAFQIAKKLDTVDMIVKAQVLAGGRGKGHFDNGYKGGVQICNTPEEVQHVAEKMLGHRLITHQSGAEGKLCTKIFIARRHFIRREMYLAILLDRATAGPVLVGSSEGGVEIEKIAAETPEKIFKMPLNLEQSLPQDKALEMARKLGFPHHNENQAAEMMVKMFDLFRAKDCTLLEINPFCETSDGDVVCVDAKLNFDDNASYRQKVLQDKVDPTQEDARDLEATQAGLNFIALDGNIGCLVNGAGLAMATMDIIKLNGGSPANFLDVGGGATEQQVFEALRLITSDAQVEAILINIFGGIMRCDIIALGLINAVTRLNIKVPLVVRLQGTCMEEAKEIIANSGLRIIAASNLDDAAKKACSVAHIVNMAKEASLDVSFELPL